MKKNHTCHLNLLKFLNFSTIVYIIIALKLIDDDSKNQLLVVISDFYQNHTADKTTNSKSTIEKIIKIGYRIIELWLFQFQFGTNNWIKTITKYLKIGSKLRFKQSHLKHEASHWNDSFTKNLRILSFKLCIILLKVE
jgi:hypothetical protein